MRRLTGEQRLRQIRRKVDLLARRQMRDFEAGRLPFFPCSGDTERAAIVAEFERVYRMGVADGRAALAEQEKGDTPRPAPNSGGEDA